MTKSKLKKFLCGIVASSILTFGAISTSEAAAIDQPLTYRTVTQVYDWGSSIPCLIVNVGQTVKSNQINKENFSVHVKRVLAEGAITMAEANRRKAGRTDVILGAETSDKDLEGDVQIENVYVSDSNGNKIDSGEYITIVLKVAPNYVLTAAMNWDPVSSYNQFVDSQFTITADKVGKIKDFCVTEKIGNIRPQADKFVYDTIQVSERMSFPYASFEPKDNKKHPLIIWLHGMGEGGNAPSLPIMANKAVQFADESIQNYFGGAYVFAPQARTWWMQGYKSFADGTSIYSDWLMEGINAYLDAHPNIDRNRIYVGGDSNGGYMTMLLVRDNPGFFAAAFPTCEGLDDSMITNDQLRDIAKTPIWFIAAKTDTTLPPEKYAVPTVRRLQRIGANVHFSYFDRVVDETGLYTKDDGSAYEYPGHWSWIYVYNDRCVDTENGRLIKLFEWMADQHK